MAVRREIRLRKEYLYRRQLAGQAAERYEKKRAVREALREGKPLPTESRTGAGTRAEEEVQDIVREMHLEGEIGLDGGLKEPEQEEEEGDGDGEGGAGKGEEEEEEAEDARIDDEYAEAGLNGPPKLCITTSRNPSSRLKLFAKELKVLFPLAQRVNRGGYTLDAILEAARGAGVTDVLVVQETRGEPDALIVCHLPFGPTAYFTLSNVVMRHDILSARAAGSDGAEEEGLKSTISEAFPHIITENFNSTVGRRTATILKFLFPMPKPDSKRVVTFANQDDYISFRHHTYARKQGKVELEEVGPRFEMHLYQIKLGRIDQKDAETEFVWRPYLNTAKRRRVL